MDLRSRLILEEYRKNREDFELISQIVGRKLEELSAASDVRTFSVQHRVKSEKSLAGKLERAGSWYTKLSDLTDIMGARIICYFNDDIDRLGSRIEETFVIDRENSSDKRELIDDESFGYLSLHYICSLPKSDDYPDRLCDWRWEIQIRTTLQHVWSDIEHDMGYKSEFGVPRAVRRGFARVSALLELADDEFVRIRDLMSGYTEAVRTSIIEGTADDVPLDTVSLNEYVRHNRSMRTFLGRLSEVCGAQVEEVDAAPFVIQLEWMGITTIGELCELLDANSDAAVALAADALAATDLDIISSSSALRYLCHAELCQRGLDAQGIAEFIGLSMRAPGRALSRAEHLLSNYARLSNADEE